MVSSGGTYEVGAPKRVCTLKCWEKGHLLVAHTHCRIVEGNVCGVLGECSCDLGLVMEGCL